MVYCVDERNASNLADILDFGTGLFVGNAKKKVYSYFQSEGVYHLHGSPKIKRQHFEMGMNEMIDESW